jgi:hypothetical protein
MRYSQRISGSSSASSASSLGAMSEPDSTSWNSWTAVARAGCDSFENGLSELVGSAAVRKNWDANPWYSAAQSIHEARAISSRSAKSLCPSIRARASAA